MQENELKAFIKENSPLMHEYINSELLKDIGVISSVFFVRLIDEIFKEAKVYFNHVKFFIKDDIFTISLVQTKAGVSTLNEEIIKFSKQFPIRTSDLNKFISKNTKLALTQSSLKIKEDIKNIF